jgi:hypothetical protein
LLIINLFLFLILIKSFIKLEGLWDLVMLLLIGLGLADVVTESEPLVSRKIITNGVKMTYSS